MERSNLSIQVVLVAGFLFALAGARAEGAVPNGPARTSLDKCQATLRAEGLKYVQGTQKAIATCLGKVSTEVVKKNAASVAAAVRTCTAQFDKIGRTDGKSLGDAFTAKVTDKCDPQPGKHTLDDLLGTGSPVVAEPLRVGSHLSQLCTHFGGDGTIDSAAEWAACLRAAQDCSVRSAIATEFPRALEWLSELAAAMPPSAARDAVVATEAAIDGASDDGLADLQCASSCGDGVRIATEQCDGADLGGVTCGSLGYASGTLGCSSSTCAFDTSACNPVAGRAMLLATGVTTCFAHELDPVSIPCAGTGQDGESHTGAPLAYMDNGDGTISDLNTGLMWEKKSDDGSLHDRNNCYPWAGRCSGDGQTRCARDSECAGPGGTCDDLALGDCPATPPGGRTVFEWLDQLNASSFAGYDDWRIPNRREMESLVNLEKLAPAISTPFQTNCGGTHTGNAGCTVTTCSCTVSGDYWTSSTYVGSTVLAETASLAWVVDFGNGRVSTRWKETDRQWVRAVRGGS